MYPNGEITNVCFISKACASKLFHNKSQRWMRHAGIIFVRNSLCSKSIRLLFVFVWMVFVWYKWEKKIYLKYGARWSLFVRDIWNNISDCFASVMYLLSTWNARHHLTKLFASLEAWRSRETLYVLQRIFLSCLNAHFICVELSGGSTDFTHAVIYYWVNEKKYKKLYLVSRHIKCVRFVLLFLSAWLYHWKNKN